MRILKVLKEPEAISHAVILLGDTNPETCSLDIRKSHKLNVDSIKNLIDDLRSLNIKPLFTSSEFVFNGVKGNYIETDPVSPILVYGEQKVEIEKYIQETCKDYIIFRLAKVYGNRLDDGTLFTSWIKSIESGKAIRCAEDQIFSPIFISDVVEIIVDAVKRDIQGVFNLAGPKGYKRIELLNVLLCEMKKYSEKNVEILPCSIHDFNLSEKRPVDISLDPSKLVKKIGFQLTASEEVCASIIENRYA